MHPRRLPLPCPARLTLALLLAVCLALAAPAAARAQAANVQAAPIAFKNLTDTTLDIESESIVDGLGLTTGLQGRWTLKPGQYSYLSLPNLEKIHATKFYYRVTAGGKTSGWVCTSNGPDANGYFNVVFTQDNLRTHLGIVVANSPPQMPPPPAAGPTAQQLQNATVKVVFAVAAHQAARRAAEDPNAGFGTMVAVGLAKELRDAAIRSAVSDLFPGLTARQSADIQLLISAAADGRLNGAHQGQQAARQRLINDLRAIAPGVADTLGVADLIYSVWQASQRP